MLPSPQPIATLLFVLVFVGTVLLGDHAAVGYFATDPAALARGENIPSLFIAPWMAPERAIGTGALMCSLAVFWFFGCALERFWGRWRFALFVVGLAVAGWSVGMVAAMLWLPPHDEAMRSTLCLHVVVLAGFGVVFRERSLSPLGLIQMPGWAAALIAAVAVLGVEVGAGSPPAVFVAAGVSTGLALLVAFAPWRRRQDAGTPIKKKAAPSHLKLVYSADDLLN